MLRNKLKKGDILSVYTDYQDEDESTYEGKAKLIEKVKIGDSFYLKDEEIRIREKKSYTKDEENKIHKYNLVKKYFYGTDEIRVRRYVKLIYGLLCKERKDLPDDFDRMNQVLEKHKNQPYYKLVVKDLDKFDRQYIFRFIQQDREKWRPTIWKYERWIVEFTEDNSGWPSTFRTQRNFRLVSCIMPSENIRDADIRRYTTYNNGVPSIKTSKIEDSDDDLDIDLEEELVSDEDLKDFIIE